MKYFIFSNNNIEPYQRYAVLSRCYDFHVDEIKTLFDFDVSFDVLRFCWNQLYFFIYLYFVASLFFMQNICHLLFYLKLLIQVNRILMLRFSFFNIKWDKQYFTAWYFSTVFFLGTQRIKKYILHVLYCMPFMGVLRRYQVSFILVVMSCSRLSNKLRSLHSDFK